MWTLAGAVTRGWQGCEVWGGLGNARDGKGGGNAFFFSVQPRCRNARAIDKGRNWGLCGTAGRAHHLAVTDWITALLAMSHSGAACQWAQWSDLVNQYTVQYRDTCSINHGDSPHLDPTRGCAVFVSPLRSSPSMTVSFHITPRSAPLEPRIYATSQVSAGCLHTACPATQSL